MKSYRNLTCKTITGKKKTVIRIEDEETLVIKSVRL